MTRPIQVALFFFLAFQSAFCQLAPFSIQNDQNVMDKSVFFDTNPKPNPIPNPINPIPSPIFNLIPNAILNSSPSPIYNPFKDEKWMTWMKNLQKNLQSGQKIKNPYGEQVDKDKTPVVQPAVVQPAVVGPNPPAIGIEDLPRVNKPVLDKTGLMQILQNQNEERNEEQNDWHHCFDAQTWTRLNYCNRDQTWRFCVDKRPCRRQSDCKNYEMCSETPTYHWDRRFKVCMYGDRKKRSADEPTSDITKPNEMMDAHPLHPWPDYPSTKLWRFCIRYKPCFRHYQCPPMGFMNGRCVNSDWTTPGGDDYMICKD